MTRVLLVELLVGLLALSTTLGFHLGWQAGDRVFKPLAVVVQPEVIAERVVPEPVEPASFTPAGEQALPDPLPALPWVSRAEQPATPQPNLPLVGSDAGAAAAAVPALSTTGPGGSRTGGAAAECRANLSPSAGLPPAATLIPSTGPAPAQAGARHHVQAAACDTLQDALAVAERLQSMGYSVSLASAGPWYQVTLAGEFDAATASRLVQTLQHAGFAAELIQ